MPAVETIRVLLVDDHAMVRESIAHVLQEDAGFDVTHCGSVVDALDALSGKNIDLLLLDYDLGVDRATDLIVQLDRVGFTGRVVILTAYVNDAAARHLVQMGVSGILLKSDSLSSLGACLRDIHDGHTCFHVTPAPRADGTETSSRRNALTPRERATLHEVVNGLSNKEIASLYTISESSVKATIQRLFLKTGARTRGQLVRLALERDLDPVCSAQDS